MKNKVLFKICLISFITVLLFGSCKHDSKLGHLLRVIVYYPCPGYYSNMMYPGAPQKQDYGIYQVLVHMSDDNLTDEMLETMNTRVKACGIQNFSGKWYADSDFTTQQNAGKLTSSWDDNYHNYLIYTKVDEDLTPRFTEYIVRDSKSVYRFNSSHQDIFPVDTTSVNFSDELQSRSYNPYVVNKVYYVNKTTGLKENEWHAGQPLQGKKLFVDLNSNWSEQSNIKFVNSVQRLSTTHGASYKCESIQESMKIKDFFPNIFNQDYEYLKIYKGSFLASGELEWNKNKVYTADDTVNLFELIRIDTCIIKLNIYIIDQNGTTEDFTYMHDIAYEIEEDTISEYDLGAIGNDVNNIKNIVHAENSSWKPMAYYKAKSADEADGLPDKEVIKSVSGDTYILIKDDIKTEKLNNSIYILVEETL